jgi:hypothetical protein
LLQVPPSITIEKKQQQKGRVWVKRLTNCSSRSFVVVVVVVGNVLGTGVVVGFADTRLRIEDWHVGDGAFGSREEWQVLSTLDESPSWSKVPVGLGDFWLLFLSGRKSKTPWECDRNETHQQNTQGKC